MIFECSWDIERPTITSRFINSIRYTTWINWEWIIDVGVPFMKSAEVDIKFHPYNLYLLRPLSIALQLPHPRNLDISPSSYIECPFKELRRSIKGAFGQVELPGARKR